MSGMHGPDGQAITAKQWIKAAAAIGYVIGLCPDEKARKEASKAWDDISGHVDALEGLLNDTDDRDFFGTQGWRYVAGIDG